MLMVFHTASHCIHTSCKSLRYCLCCFNQQQRKYISFGIFEGIWPIFVLFALHINIIHVIRRLWFISSLGSWIEFNCTHLLCWNSDRQYVHLTIGKEPLHSWNEKKIPFKLLDSERFLLKLNTHIWRARSWITIWDTRQTDSAWHLQNKQMDRIKPLHTTRGTTN